MSSNIKTHRLFFALWPTVKVRQSIVKLISQLPRQINGRVIQPQNLHETLHFVGQVTESTKDCMHAAAQSVNAESFHLNLDCFGHFPKAKIFWMGVQNTPVQLTQLHEQLGMALADCGLTRERRPYMPHVTLMRKCTEPVIEYEEFSLPWYVEGFSLIESVQGVSGVEYRVVDTYPLS